MKVFVLLIIPCLLERILFTSVTPWLLKASRTSDSSHSWKSRQRIIFCRYLVNNEEWWLLLGLPMSSWLEYCQPDFLIYLRSEHFHCEVFCFLDVSYCTFKQFLNTKDRKFDGLVIFRCHNQKAWTNLFFVQLSFFIEGIHGDSEHFHYPHTPPSPSDTTRDVRNTGWTQALEHQGLEDSILVKDICHEYLTFDSSVAKRSTNGWTLGLGLAWQPIDQTGPHLTSRLGWNPGHSHQLFWGIRGYLIPQSPGPSSTLTGRITANELPAKWSQCPESRLLRQVGPTVGLDYADPDNTGSPRYPHVGAISWTGNKICETSYEEAKSSTIQIVDKLSTKLSTEGSNWVPVLPITVF